MMILGSHYADRGYPDALGYRNFNSQKYHGSYKYFIIESDVKDVEFLSKMTEYGLNLISEKPMVRKRYIFFRSINRALSVFILN